MRSTFLLALFGLLMLGAGSLGAQTIITIGVAGQVNNFPFNYSVGNGRFQWAYSSTEINQSGGCTIDEIRVWGSTVTPPTYNNFRLRLAHSSLTPQTITGTFDTNYTGTLSTCIGPVNFTPQTVAGSGGTWYRFPLTTSFVYNGTSTLLIDVSYDSRTGTGWLINSGSGRNRVYLNGGSSTSPTGTASNSGDTQVQLYVVTGPGLAVTANAGTASSVRADDTGTGANGIMAGRFTVAANAQGAATLNNIQIQAAGTGLDNTAYSEVRLYEDTNSNNTYEPGTDTAYGSAATAFPADNGSITFTQTANFAASQTRTYLIVCKLNGSTLATPGQTFNFTVQSISVQSPATGSGTPSATINGFTISAPTIAFADASPAQNNAGPGQSAVPVASFSLTMTSSVALTLQTLTVGLTAGAGGALTDVNRIDIYTDLNGDDLINGSDASIGNVTTIAASNQITVSQALTAAPPAATLNYIIALSYNLSAPNNSTFQAQLTASTWSYGGTWSPTGLPTTLSAGTLILANNLSLTRNGPAASQTVDNDEQGNGGNGIVLLDFTLATIASTWTVTDLTFTESGTADGQTALDYLALHEDSNANGSYDGAATDLLATASAATAFNGANGTYTAQLMNQAWPQNTSRRFFLVTRLAGQAIAGQTLKAELTTVNATTTGTGSILGAPTSAPNVAFTIAAARLDVTLNGPLAYTVVNSNSQGPNNDGHVICDVTLACKNDSWTVSNLTFTESGTMNAATALNFLGLYVDANGNGTFDGPTTDPLAEVVSGTAFNAANGTYTANLNTQGSTFTVNEQKRLFLVAKLASTALAGETLRAALTSMNHVSPTGGTVTGVPTAATSALIIDVATLTVGAGPGNPVNASREQNAAGFQHVLGQLQFTSSNGSFTVTGVTLTVSGTGDWVNDLAPANGVQLFEDNGNLSFDAGDIQLFSGPGTNVTMPCAFTTNLALGNNQSKLVWLVLNLAGTAGASPSDSFSASIAATTDVVVAGGGNVQLGTLAPVSSTLKVIVFAVSNFTPTASLPAGGGAITISGSGFALPVTLTINGVACPGTAAVNASGTQITGLSVPAGVVSAGLPIVLTTNGLAPRTLSQTFTYSSGGGLAGIGEGDKKGGGGGGPGCVAGAGQALPLAALALLATPALLRRRRR
jgi:hypothetical protein